MITAVLVQRVPKRNAIHGARRGDLQLYNAMEHTRGGEATGRGGSRDRANYNLETFKIRRSRG